MNSDFMAEAEEEKEGQAEATPEAAPKKSKKTLFIVIGLVVLLLGAGIPVLMLRSGAKTKIEEVDADAASQSESGHPEGSEDEVELEDGEDPLGAIVPFDTFVVNLPDNHFLRVQLQVEFATLDVPRRFYVKIVPLRDAIINLLSQKTPDELKSPKGKETLRADIKELINNTLRKEDIKRVYFTQLVIQ